MKRILCLLSALFLITSFLSGCFLYDSTVGDNISPFIDPLNTEGDTFLPDSNAEKKIVLDIEDPVTIEEKDDEEDEDNGIITLSENSIRQTKPPIVEVNEDGQLNYYYEGDTFTFQIPFLWRTTMEVDILWETDENYEITYYTFYFVPGDQPYNSPYKAQVMSLRVVPYAYYQRHGHGDNGYAATGTVNASDGFVYTYYTPPDDQKLSSDFPKLEDYGTIIKVLTNNWNFKHIKAN